MKLKDSIAQYRCKIFWWSFRVACSLQQRLGAVFTKCRKGCNLGCKQESWIYHGLAHVSDTNNTVLQQEASSDVKNRNDAQRTTMDPLSTTSRSTRNNQVLTVNLHLYSDWHLPKSGLFVKTNDLTSSLSSFVRKKVRVLSLSPTIWHKAKPRTLHREWHRAKPRTLLLCCCFAVLDQ